MECGSRSSLIAVQKKRLNKFRNTAPNKIETFLGCLETAFSAFQRIDVWSIFQSTFFLTTFLFLSIQPPPLPFHLPFTTLSLSLLTVNRTVSAENKLFLLLRVLSIVVMTGLVPHAILRKWLIHQSKLPEVLLELQRTYIFGCFFLLKDQVSHNKFAQY